MFDVDRHAGKMTLVELAPGVTEEEVRAKTGAKYDVAKDVKVSLAFRRSNFVLLQRADSNAPSAQIMEE